MSTSSTAIEKRFVLCSLSTSQARQSVNAGEAAKIVADAKQANIKANIKIMPEEVSKTVRATFHEGRREMESIGHAIKVGTEVEYLVAIGPKLQDVVDAVSLCRDRVVKYLSDEIGDDWPAYKAACLSNIGELAVDLDRAFPYDSKEQYMREFSCDLDIRPVPDPDVIPQGLTGDLADAVQGVYAGFSVQVVECLRDRLADTIEKRVDSFANLNKVTLRSFNEVMDAAGAVEEVINGSNPEMSHIATKVQEWLRGVDYSVLSPASKDYDVEVCNSLMGALTQAYTKLRAIEVTSGTAVEAGE